MLHLDEATHRIDVDLNVADTRALDRFLHLLNNTLDENDALSSKASGPLDHLLGNLVRCHDKQGLDRVGPLAQIQETHLIALCTRVVHASSEENGLPNTVRQGADLHSGTTWARLGLIEGELSIVFRREVLRRGEAFIVNIVHR